MPLQDDQILDADSSDASDQDVAQLQPVSQDQDVEQAQEAESSTAQDDPKDTALSVVRDVVDKSRKVPEAASSAEGEENKVEDAAAEPDDENYSDVPFAKHPRFRQILHRLRESEADAKSYRNVQQFMAEKGLTAEEASEALIIGAMAKTNPRETFERIKPWLRNLLIAAGEVLPESLQERVQTGELSHDAALELSRAQARAQSFEAAQTFQQQLEERRRLEAVARDMRDTAVAWEDERRTRDPNFDAKFEHLQAQVALLQRRDGAPSDPAGVKAQLNEAYRRVNEMGLFSTPAPVTRPKPQIQPVRGGAVSGKQVPTGATTLDIIRAHRRA